jgi:predicted N-acetyltransferase YhbS
MQAAFDLKKLAIQYKQECELSDSDRSSLKEILSECFADYFSDRIFYKQLSTMRLMAFHENQLVGQVAIDHRVVSVDQCPYKIFGVVDLCVTQALRNRGIATSLLEAVEDLATQCGIHHIMVFSDSHELYKKLEYKTVNTTCRFLAIENLSSHSIIEKDESKILLMKSSNILDFNNKIIDLLGHLF